MKAHRYFGIVFEERGSSTWVFLRTGKKDEFVRLAVAVFGCLTVSVRTLAVIGLFWGRLCALLATGLLTGFDEMLYWVSWVRIQENLLLSYRLFSEWRATNETPLSKTGAILFRTLESVSMTKFILNGLKSAKDAYIYIDHSTWSSNMLAS